MVALRDSQILPLSSILMTLTRVGSPALKTSLGPSRAVVAHLLERERAPRCRRRRRTRRTDTTLRTMPSSSSPTLSRASASRACLLRLVLEHRPARQHDVATALGVLGDEERQPLGDEVREVRPEAQVDVRAGGERAQAVHVHLDAALDDAGDEPLDGRLVVEGLLDDGLRALGAMRVVRQHDEAAARAVVVHDADEVGAHLEDDARDLGLAVRGRLGLGERLRCRSLRRATPRRQQARAPARASPPRPRRRSRSPSSARDSRRPAGRPRSSASGAAGSSVVSVAGAGATEAARGGGGASSSSGSSISRRSKIAFALPGMSMRIASSVISMILPKTMSPALTGGRSRGGPTCFFFSGLGRRSGRSAVASAAGRAAGRRPRRARRPRPPPPACPRPAVHRRTRRASSCGAAAASSSRRAEPRPCAARPASPRLRRRPSSPSPPSPSSSPGGGLARHARHALGVRRRRPTRRSWRGGRRLARHGRGLLGRVRRRVVRGSFRGRHGSGGARA